MIKDNGRMIEHLYTLKRTQCLCLRKRRIAVRCRSALINVRHTKAAAGHPLLDSVLLARDGVACLTGETKILWNTTCVDHAHSLTRRTEIGGCRGRGRGGAFVKKRWRCVSEREGLRLRKMERRKKKENREKVLSGTVMCLWDIEERESGKKGGVPRRV